MILWRFFDKILMISMQTIMIIIFYCANVRNTDVSLLVHRWFVDGSLKNHWSYSKEFVAKIKDHKCFFWPDLRNIDVSLLLHWWSLMILWREVFETLTKSMEKFLIFFVFLVLTSKSLIIHYRFLDDSLMMLWRDIVGALINS